MFQSKGLALPPPNGAQMTRRMALTQSSISVWEFAMSRKDSWLIGARSFSPVPPAGTNERGGRRGKRRGEHSRERKYFSFLKNTGVNHRANRAVCWLADKHCFCIHFFLRLSAKCSWISCFWLQGQQTSKKKKRGCSTLIDLQPLLVQTQFVFLFVASSRLPPWQLIRVWGSAQI